MFSKATEYALRATIYIAKEGSEEKKLSLEEISLAIDSPQSFTAKILQVLTKKNKIVSSVRGPNGGFYLSAKQKKLSMSTILEVMEEKEVLEKCVMGMKMCSEAQPCPMHAQFKAIRKQLKELFMKKSIQEFVSEVKEGVVFVSTEKNRK